MIAKDFFKKIINNIKPECWMIEGNECSSGEPLAILFAGSPYSRHYICKIAYQGEHQETSLGRKWFWDIPHYHERANDGSLIVMEGFYCLFQFLPKKDCFVVPVWVSSIVALSGRPRYEEKRSLKNDMRRIKRNKFSFCVTCDSSQLGNFYYNMYIPFIKRVHGEGAILNGYKALVKKLGRTCSLGLIEKDGELVGGDIFCLRNKKRAKIWLLGVKDANPEYVKEGVVQAMFHFTINAFIKKGIRSADLGLSRPFLNDGPLRFKKKWAPLLICRKWQEKVFLITFSSLNSGIKMFLQNNPFVFIEKKELKAAYFSNSSLSSDEGQRIRSYCAFEGLSELCVYRFEGDEAIVDVRHALR